VRFSTSLRFAALALLGIGLVSTTRPAGANNGSAYSFNPLAVKRDPFLPPEAGGAKTVRELNRYEISEMQLVAVMTGLGAPQAMIVLPNGSTHIVQTGDSIGPRDGKVSRIASSEIAIRETFKDFQGNRKSSVTNLVLAP